MAPETRRQLQHDPRRGSVRYATRLDVRYGRGDVRFRAPVENLSVGGMCIRTNDVLPPGSPIQLAIEICGQDVRLTGEVVWSIRVAEHETETMVHGMGIQLVNPPAEWAGIFAEWKSGL